MSAQLLTADDVRELFDYDPVSGAFRWRSARRRPNLPADLTAGTRHSEGYRRVSVKGRLYYVHRLIWAYVHDRWPAEDIDHLNGDRSDNRLCNLREASRSLNNENIRTARSHSTSGMLGAHRTPWGRWASSIRVRGRILYLGCYDTANEAHQAYLSAKIKFHEGYVP